MAMKEYFTIPKALELEPHHQLPFSAPSRTLVEGAGGYLSEEIQSAYSTAPVD